MQDDPSRTGQLHHEDLEIGTPILSRGKTLSKEEIIAFASAYDPQAMHLDEVAARQTLVGGLCASGFHTCALMMRLVADSVLNRVASLGSPGVDEVRWLKPVRPGTTLRTRYTPLEKRVLGSRPDVGVAKVLVELVDAQDGMLCTWRTNQLTRVRSPAPATAAPTQRNQKPALRSLWDLPQANVGDWPDLPFEDRHIDEISDLGRHTFGRDEIVEFARQFDPQPFHLDEAAAKASLFGGLCASGWHTAAHFIRGIVTTRQRVNADARARGLALATYGPSPGFRNLLWFKPVFVGDTIEYRSRLAEKIILKSRPERGLLASEAQGRNQHGEIVFAITAQILAERRSSQSMIASD